MDAQSNVTDNEDEDEGTPFEEALTLAGFGKFNGYIIILCGLIMIGMISEALGFSYIIPASQCDLNMSLNQKGWLAAAPFMGMMITAHMWGYLADTRGRKKILAFCMTVSSFFSITSSFAPNLIVFGILRFISGIFCFSIGGPAALGYTYLGEMNPSQHRDKMLILGNATAAMGTGVVPLIAGVILPLDFYLEMGYIIYRPWRLLVILLALPYFFCAIIIIKFPESPKYLMGQGEKEKALEGLKFIFSVNTGKNPNEYPIKLLRFDENVKKNKQEQSFFRDVCDQTLPLFTGQYLKYTCIICFIYFGCFATTNGFYVWFPAIVNDLLKFQAESNSQSGEYNICDILASRNNHSDDSHAITPKCDDSINPSTFKVSIILGFTITLITIGFAFLSKITGKRYLLCGLFLVIGTNALILHWIKYTLPAIILLSSMQFGGTCVGLFNAYVIEIYPTYFRAMAICITQMVGRLGSVAGTNMMGHLTENICLASFFTFGAIQYLYFVLSLYAFQEDRIKKIKNL